MMKQESSVDKVILSTRTSAQLKDRTGECHTQSKCMSLMSFEIFIFSILMFSRRRKINSFYPQTHHDELHRNTRFFWWKSIRTFPFQSEKIFRYCVGLIHIYWSRSKSEKESPQSAQHPISYLIKYCIG